MPSKAPKNEPAEDEAASINKLNKALADTLDTSEIKAKEPTKYKLLQGINIVQEGENAKERRHEAGAILQETSIPEKSIPWLLKTGTMEEYVPSSPSNSDVEEGDDDGS